MAFLKGHLHETAKIGLIFAVQLILPGHLSDFCKHLTDITLHKIEWRDRKIPISKLVGEPSKIGCTACQNLSDMTKIGSATVHVNGAYEVKVMVTEEVGREN
jgi:hypothetical protein